MNPTSEILERVNKSSSEHHDGVFTRLFRYLLREDIYFAAYQKLYANSGAMTPGSDNDTADGFSAEYVHELIEELRSGKYKPKPVRREYIKKQNGKCAHWVFRHFEINFCKRRLECFWKQSMNRYFMTSHMVSDRREVVIQLSTR